MTKTKPTPPPSPIIYRDHRAIYLEFPTYALRFEFTQGGLAKALQHVPLVPTAFGHLTGGSNVMSKVLPKVAKATKRKREILNISVEAHASAIEIVRKMEPK